MRKQNFVNRSKETIMAYKSLARLHVEYCIQVWHSYLTKDIKLIGVQQWATKLVQHIDNLKYAERVKNLGLT